MAKQTLTTGKRKTCVARATVSKGKGALVVNHQEYTQYFSSEFAQLKVLEPLLLADAVGKYDISVNVQGGGKNSQVDATRQAIARALVEISGSEELKKQFLAYDRALLVSDTRFKEAKKPNNSHARAKRQKSYR